MFASFCCIHKQLWLKSLITIQVHLGIFLLYCSRSWSVVRVSEFTTRLDYMVRFEKPFSHSGLQKQDGRLSPHLTVDVVGLRLNLDLSCPSVTCCGLGWVLLCVSGWDLGSFLIFEVDVVDGLLTIYL